MDFWAGREVRGAGQNVLGLKTLPWWLVTCAYGMKAYVWLAWPKKLNKWMDRLFWDSSSTEVENNYKILWMSLNTTLKYINNKQMNSWNKENKRQPSWTTNQGWKWKAFKELGALGDVAKLHCCVNNRILLTKNVEELNGCTHFIIQSYRNVTVKLEELKQKRKKPEFNQKQNKYCKK